MALVSCWSCGLDFDNPGTVDIYCPSPDGGAGEWMNVTPPDDMDGPDCQNCRKRLREKHCPQALGGKKPIGKAPIGGFSKASGKTFAEKRNDETIRNVSIFLGLTAASAYIGSKVAKNKTKGAVIGGVGYAVAVYLYMQMKNRGK